MQNKINCSRVLKDGKILKAVHSRFEHHHCSKLCDFWHYDCNNARQRVTRHEALANGARILQKWTFEHSGLAHVCKGHRQVKKCRVDTHGERMEREPITGDWGWSPSGIQGPWSGGNHGEPALFFGPHTNTQPFYGSMDFVRDNPGELVPEETFTHSHLSWGHQLSLICFFHLIRSIASSLFHPHT